MTDLDQRLKNAVAERDRLSTAAQRVLGRKEAAALNLKEVEKEIRAKNLDPDTLDETVAKFEKALKDEVVMIEAGVSKAQADLKPYLEIT